MNVRILRSARRTIADGIEFYERQETGLGAYFLASIMSDLRIAEHLRRNPSKTLRLFQNGLHQISLFDLLSKGWRGCSSFRSPR